MKKAIGNKRTSMLIFKFDELLHLSELQQYVAAPTPATPKLIGVQVSEHILVTVLITTAFVVTFLKYKLLV